MRPSLLLLLALALTLAACQDEAPPVEDSPVGLSADGEEGEDYEAFDPARGKADGLSFSNGPLSFKAACEPGDTLTIAAVGDVLLHGRLQQQALRDDKGFVSLWAGIEDLLQQADLTYANLEGPTAQGVDARGRDVADPGRAWDNYVYSSYPQFNYHKSLLEDLQASGVDVVSTANNHSLDRRALGADRTLDALDAIGMPYTGTRRAGDDAASWATYTEARGFRIAWIACTYGTNGIPDNKDQVRHCYQDTEALLDEVRALSQEPGVDAVIVTPHWGQEYKANPDLREVKLGHDFLEAGATAVIGSHPHVLQPWEKYITRDGRETFAIYSLGNFVSGQRQLARRSTLLLYLGLQRGEDGVTRVSGARYVPLHMTTRANGFLTLESTDRAQAYGDSRALTTSMFGLWNLHDPALPLNTTPQCDPNWSAPHPLDGWIGGACASEDAQACGDAFCDETFPGGLCTTPCERYCPDLSGRASTFCVADSSGEGGLCTAQCKTDQDCRSGYRCQEAPRFGEPEVLRQVCLPQ